MKVVPEFEQFNPPSDWGYVTLLLSIATARTGTDAFPS